jgi:hypothetical protein
MPIYTRPSVAAAATPAPATVHGSGSSSSSSSNNNKRFSFLSFMQSRLLRKQVLTEKVLKTPDGQGFQEWVRSSRNALSPQPPAIVMKPLPAPIAAPTLERQDM